MRFFLLLIISVIVCQPSLAADGNEQYEMLRTAVNLTPAEILEKAGRARRDGDDKNALMLYMILASRKDQALSEEEMFEVATAFKRSGDIYYYGGHYTKALSQYLEGLRISEKISDKTELVELFKCIGNVYCMFEDYEKAIDIYNKGLAILKNHPNDEVEYMLMLNSAYAYVYMGKSAEARRAYTAAQAIPHKHSREEEFQDGIYHSMILKIDRHHDEAVRMIYPLLALARRDGLNARFECAAYEELYRNYWAMGQTDSTLLYTTRCYHTAKDNGVLHMFSETLIQLAEVYEKKGDAAKANYYRSQYQSMMDSSFNKRDFSIVKNQLFIYEMEKIDREIGLLNAEREDNLNKIRFQNIAMTVFFVILVAVGILLIIVLRQKRNLDESYRSLYGMNTRLLEMHRQMARAGSAAPDTAPAAGAAAPEAEHGDGAAESVAESEAPGEAEGEAESECGSEAESEAAGDAARRRACSSKMSHELKAALIGKISHVMEDTVEYASEDFSLERLAELTGSNCKYVSQVINEHYNKNFSNFINEYRIRLACERLTDPVNFGNYTIQAISASVGYKSNTTFVNVFRKITGMTPSAYQKIAREEKSKTNN